MKSLSVLLLLPLFSSPALTQIVVEGTVTGRAGQPEAAVLVRIESLSVGATTRADGTYRLTIPDSRIEAGARVTITATRTGLSAISHSLTLSPGARLTQNFQMGTEPIVLEDIVTTGTGLERVSGQTVLAASGRPGPAPSILLRRPANMEAVGRGEEPVYVVDGVVLDASPVDIDPAEIESLEVVKGASGVQVYGARAANGVVRVTTRRAREQLVIGARGGALRWSYDFPWPPPRWTTRHDLPPRLFEGGRTLGDAFARLRDALVRAGYDEWGVYGLGRDGFVVVARREVIDEAGEPIPPRWSEAEEELSWGAYFRSLVFADPGRYRIIAIVVSPRPLRPGGTADEGALARMTLDGSRNLPPERAGTPLATGTQYVALIYEFYRRSEDSPIRLVTRSRISSVDHLSRAQLWTRQELLGGR